MTTTIANITPYLRTSRNFPEDPQPLSVELRKMYIDVATAVNSRSIGIFSTAIIITGNTWYIQGGNLKQQTLRQVYTFSATTAINHGIQNVIPGQFVDCFGSYTDGTSTYGLVFGTSVAVAGIVQFYVTATQIVFVVGAGAPALSSGRICLEWLSSP